MFYIFIFYYFYVFILKLIPLSYRFKHLLIIYSNLIKINHQQLIIKYENKYQEHKNYIVYLLLTFVELKLNYLVK